MLPINDDLIPAAKEVARDLRDAGLRVHVDDRAETLNYKIRDAETHKVAYMAVIGAREAEAGTVAVRARGEGKKQEVMSRAAFKERLLAQINSKALAEGGTAG